MIEFLIFGPLLGSLISGFMYRSTGENVAIILATSIVIVGGSERISLTLVIARQ